jgi:hypothetical protein
MHAQCWVLSFVAAKLNNEIWLDSCVGCMTSRLFGEIHTRLALRDDFCNSRCSFLVFIIFSSQYSHFTMSVWLTSSVLLIYISLFHNTFYYMTFTSTKVYSSQTHATENIKNLRRWLFSEQQECVQCLKYINIQMLCILLAVYACVSYDP